MGLARSPKPARIVLGIDPVAATKGATGVKVTGEPLVIDAPADALVAAVANQLLAHFNHSIRAGVDAKTGGSKPPIKPRVARRPGRRSQYRGFNTGELADDLERGPVTGDDARARTRIQHPDQGRAIFLSDETQRGVHHTSVEGASRTVIEDAVRRFAEQALGTAREVDAAARVRSRDRPGEVVRSDQAAKGA